MTQNSATRNPAGFIELVLRGDQTADSYEGLYLESLPLVEELHVEQVPVRCLIDLSEEGRFTALSNKAALELLERVDFDRLAIYKAPAPGVAKGVIAALGQPDRMRYFEDRAAAIDWLVYGDAGRPQN